jgi:hypothetical protein
MTLRDKFSGCKNINDYIDIIKSLSNDECDQIVDKYLKCNFDEMCTDDDIDIFFEMFKDNPNALTDSISLEKVNLSRTRAVNVLNKIMEKHIFQASEENNNKLIQNELLEKTRGISNDRNVLNNDGEKLDDITYRKALLRALYFQMLIDALISNNFKVKLSMAGQSYYYLRENMKIEKEMIKLKEEIENKEERIQSNLTTTAGLMIALFSIIGFNVYSIDNVLSVPSILIMNESILLAISVMFYLIQKLKNETNIDRDIFPVIVLLVIILFVTLFMYN